jgi:hypothetical protein
MTIHLISVCAAWIVADLAEANQGPELAGLCLRRGLLPGFELVIHRPFARDDVRVMVLIADCPLEFIRVGH